MLSCSHWGIHGGPIAEPMTSHGEPVYGDVLWWVTDDRTVADCVNRFDNVLNVQSSGMPSWWAGSEAYRDLNYGQYMG